ncbi:MAG: hypothetical protein ACJ790_03770 [Myxococcaceae bacterium]
MSRFISEEEYGSCDVVDVLEEAVLAKTPIEIQLASGERFSDIVEDVVTENHDDFAVFRSHPRVSVHDVKLVSKPEHRPGLILGDVEA